MTASHTPGPWVVDHDGYYPLIVKWFNPIHNMKIAGPIHGYMYSENQKANQAANAHLISAAPDMLEFLERCADQSCELGPDHEACGRLDDDDCFGCRARTIIAKAKGTPA